MVKNRVSREELDELIANLDIEQYLDVEGIDYHKTSGSRGPQLNLRTCPVCGTDKWKVFIGAETGLGNCFSGDCQATFNKFSFIRAYTGCEKGRDVIDHIVAFSREMGWRPAKQLAVAVDNERGEIRLPPYLPLPIKGRNLKYLQNRGVDLEMAKYFNLGYIKEGFYGKRILIPIYDLDGVLATFQARDITGEAEMKYLFPKGGAVTGKILFNGQNAWRAKQAVLAEGVFDVIATQIAFRTEPELRRVAVLGSFGMHLSGTATSGEDDQLTRFIQLREAGLEQVCLMWDGEKRALVKACDAAEVLTSIGLKVKIATLPADKDPNEIAAPILRHCYYKAIPATPMNIAKLRMTTYK